MISFEDFKKVEIKVGKILSADKIPETDKLLKLSVDFGLKPISPKIGSPDHSSENDLWERDVRQIVSGISTYFPDPQTLVGKKCAFVTNLETRIIKGFESHGMILALSDEDGKFALLSPSSDIVVGTLAK